MAQNNQRIVFDVVFGNWGTQNGPKKVNIGPQVGGMYGPMSELKNKPLTKSGCPIFQEKWSKTTKEQDFYAVFGHLGAIWAPPKRPKGMQRTVIGQDIWPNV
jgi:hypothetical protein